MTKKKNFNSYAKTTLIGGLVAILPLGLIIVLFRWMIGMVETYLEPIVNLFNTSSKTSTIIVYVLSVISIIVLFFIIGLVIQTKFGNFIKNYTNKVLVKIPGYQTASDIVKQLFGGNKSFFSEVVLVDIYNSGTLMTGFVTDRYDSTVTVFVPTGPNPTSGNIYHVQEDKVIKSYISVDVAIKSIISCGAGSSDVFNNTKL